MNDESSLARKATAAAISVGSANRPIWMCTSRRAARSSLERSELAVEAFGPAAHRHLVTSAKNEWAAFGRTVTDWERRRCFEQY